MSCIYKIRESMNLFTVSEKKIANYILDYPDDILSSSVQKLAEKSGVSEASWVRFSRKLGYKGLQDLKVELAKDKSIQTIETSDLGLDPTDTVSQIIEKNKLRTFNTLKNTYHLLEEDKLYQAIDFLDKSRTIYLCGVGGSGIVCLDFANKLMRLNKPTIYHEDFHTLMMRLSYITKEDVLVAFSYSGKTSQVNHAVNYAKKVGAKVIAVTKFDIKNELAAMSTITLYIPTEEKEVRLGAISSRNAALTVMDILYFGFAQRHYDETLSDLQLTMKVISDLN